MGDEESGPKYKADYLVVDTTAFIEHANLQNIGRNIITVQNVVDEITSKRQLRRLVVLPYDLEIKDVFPENVAFVSEFSKKTGDYPSLSATDIKVMALVYQLEKQHVGDKHLNSAPKLCPTITSRPPSVPIGNPAGFYGSEDEKVDGNSLTETTEGLGKENELETELNELDKPRDSVEDGNCTVNTNLDSKSLTEITEGLGKEKKLKKELNELTQPRDSVEDGNCTVNTNLLEEKFAELKCDVELDKSPFHNVLVKVEDDSVIDEDEVEEDSDEEGWITPNNIKQIKNEMDSELLEDKPVTVACITMDFAMQNVLKQIGLNIVTIDGRVIKQLRTFILRCYACFKTTSIMTKVFCPKCGNKTLKKVSVSLDENGQQRIHINFSKPISTRGIRFSLPTPKGGKHANNPILVDRQPMPDQRPTRLARTRNNPLDPDYIAGFSPFIMRDVNSKSAMLGIRSSNKEVKHWMRKNPNEVKKTNKKKKK